MHHNTICACAADALPNCSLASRVTVFVCQQVQKTADGAWENLLVPEGYVAVLAGHTLEHATCGMVKAVKHRVVSTKRAVATTVLTQ